MMDKELFTHDERQFMAHLSNLLRQSEAEGTDNEQVFLDMEVAGDRFDEVHGEGSVRSIFNRVHQALAVKREQSALLRRCAMRVLGPQLGDLASWLNDADAEFLRQIGVTL
jgi:hypothetical protein